VGLEVIEQDIVPTLIGTPFPKSDTKSNNTVLSIRTNFPSNGDVVREYRGLFILFMYIEKICMLPSFTKIVGKTFVTVRVNPLIEQIGVGVLTLDGHDA